MKLRCFNECPLPFHFNCQSNCASFPDELIFVSLSQEFLQIMSVKDYRYEDPSKDLEKVIALIQSQRAYVLDDVLAAVGKFIFKKCRPPCLLTTESKL